MSRQVALGGVIGFLVTVLTVAVCQRSEAPPPSESSVQRVDHLEPARLAPPDRLPVLRPIPVQVPPAAMPRVAQPLNLEGFDAGHR